MCKKKELNANGNQGVERINIPTADNGELDEESVIAIHSSDSGKTRESVFIKKINQPEEN